MYWEVRPKRIPITEKKLPGDRGCRDNYFIKPAGTFCAFKIQIARSNTS
jgi:hypothetical protein